MKICLSAPTLTMDEPSAESDAVDESLVHSQARIKLERDTMVEDQARVIAPSSCSQRSLLPYRDAIDLRAVS